MEDSTIPYITFEIIVFIYLTGIESKSDGRNRHNPNVMLKYERNISNHSDRTEIPMNANPKLVNRNNVNVFAYSNIYLCNIVFWSAVRST